MTEEHLPPPGTYYEAADRGGTNIVIENPSGEWLDDYPTVEAAQARALALNLWLDTSHDLLSTRERELLAARPDGDVVEPFFDTSILNRAPRDPAEALDAILHKIAEPEERLFGLSVKVSHLAADEVERLEAVTA